ncbi:nuclear transport factor 2 family protein [Flavobacterium silvaticum]|uniref:Nuclear transport factor 2 family protein n=1 Tax=Flavobacterium silvaticum TaxID=1852020 RepID=A0A972JGU3_9FLAO|nr:nuclear transport factor 2 family protein [Flavobacterium silvaticum]NMH28556.1 nuclear transport factor 2 family protein [Flavobacterium silvaticum]
MSTSVKGMIDQYILAWNQKSLGNYAAGFSKCWAKNGQYADPYGTYDGLDAIVNFASKSGEIVPERVFSILEEPEFHNHYGRYAWKVALPDGQNTGYDYFEFDENFRITKLVSFFKLPDDYPIEKLQ